MKPQPPLKLPLPSKPQQFTARRNNMSINLSWAPCSNDSLALPQWVHIERSTDNGVTWTEIIGNKPYGTTFIGLSYGDTTVVIGTTYIYRIRFQNATGFSPYSANSGPLIVTLPLPAQPTGLVAVLA